MSSDRLIPTNLPYEWHSAWCYTLNRSSGAGRREIIREILKAGKLDLFSTSDVLTGDLQCKWHNYLATGKAEFNPEFNNY